MSHRVISRDRESGDRSEDARGNPAPPDFLRQAKARRKNGPPPVELELFDALKLPSLPELAPRYR